MQSMDTYTRTFTITNEKGNKEQKIHTWKNPYPEMFLKPSEKNEEETKEKNPLMRRPKKKIATNKRKFNMFYAKSKLYR